MSISDWKRYLEILKACPLMSKLFVFICKSFSFIEWPSKRNVHETSPRYNIDFE